MKRTRSMAWHKRSQPEKPFFPIKLEVPLDKESAAGGCLAGDSEFDVFSASEDTEFCCCAVLNASTSMEYPVIPGICNNAFLKVKKKERICFLYSMGKRN